MHEGVLAALAWVARHWLWPQPMVAPVHTSVSLSQARRHGPSSEQATARPSQVSALPAVQLTTQPSPPPGQVTEPLAHA